ncbi:DUF2971 domain-containing protein [Flagellimonas oceanensis]|uniref:DUF2971 domain-containing protein n=1 Tax=Flagellimonas oceanensis TaxID=2499163 RepID=UPI000F8CF5E8|nr:DUF2971 domain-containing protein [Allomuricauda oceanensis]
MSKLFRKWNTYNTKSINKDYLFRYMSKSKVLSLLETKSLYMPSMNRFDDKLEGISTYDITEVRVAYEFCFIDREEKINPELIEDWKQAKEVSKEKLLHISKTLRKTQESHYISCWFNSNRESDGMWRFYAKENGFAVKVNRRKFQNKIKSSIPLNDLQEKQRIVVGRIKYQDYPRVIENEKDNTVLYLSFRKDESFSHEKEYRVVFIDLNTDAEKPNHVVYKIIDFEELEITIITHPAMPEEKFEESKVLFESLGKNITVQKSELEPFYQFFDRTEKLKE